MHVPAPGPMVDGHLDLAYNVGRGRDLRQEVARIRAGEGASREQCMVTLPELRRAGIAVACASVYTVPARDPGGEPVFAPLVAASGREQVLVYRQWESEGLVRIIRGRDSLREHLRSWLEDRVPGLLVAMESADPIERPDDLGWWFDAGVRMIGPAWGPTRYCGGFEGPRGRATGLTALGRELITRMDELGVILDLAHMSAASCAESLASGHRHICLTHTTPREMVGIDRFPDNEVLGRIANQGGVVGIGLGNVFFDIAWWEKDAPPKPVPLEAVGRALALTARATGWDHVGIGSDLDGGSGLEETPVGLETIADIGRVAELVPPESAAGVLGGNWLRFFEAALPAG